MLYDWIQDKENMFLEGVYAPVQEEVSRECEVVGTIPEAVYGEYARNGPNPRFTPAGGYHWFDGDGMVSPLPYSRTKNVIMVPRSHLSSGFGVCVFSSWNEPAAGGTFTRKVKHHRRPLHA